GKVVGGGCSTGCSRACGSGAVVVGLAPDSPACWREGGCAADGELVDGASISWSTVSCSPGAARLVLFSALGAARPVATLRSGRGTARRSAAASAAPPRSPADG